MSGTWAVVWPSGKPYSFHYDIDAATQAAVHASVVQNCPMRAILWR